MFAVSALLAVFLPWLMVPALAVLIWKLRQRRLRAGVAGVALLLLILTQFREFAYLLGFPSPYDDVGSAIRQLALRTEAYAWQILALAGMAAAVMAWPMPSGRGLRTLVLTVIAGLALASALTLMFKGLRFN